MEVKTVQGLSAVLFVLVLFVVLAVILHFDSRREKARVRGLNGLLKDLGLNFLPNIGKPTLLGLPRFDLFSHGHSKRVFNLSEGRVHDLRVLIFDYEYAPACINRHLIYQSVICLYLPENHIPSFYLQPEQPWHLFGKLFGLQDIEMGHDLPFSVRYLLQGSDENAIRALFTKELCAFYRAKSGVSTEMANGYFLYYKNYVRIEPDELPAFLGEALDAFMLCLDAKQSESLLKPMNSVNLE